MKREDILKDIHERWLYNPDEVEAVVRKLDDRPSLETIEAIISINAELWAEMLCLDDTDIRDTAKIIYERINK